MPRTFSETLKTARSILEKNPGLVRHGLVDTEAEQIVMSVYRACAGVELSRVDLYARSNEKFPADGIERVSRIASARAEGRPLQYLTGSQVFLDHEYGVSPAVLVPRPETEVLVEKALSILFGEGPFDRALLGAEIGLGSGIISIELLCKLPSLRMVASELSEDAARVARANADRILRTDRNHLEIVMAARSEVWEPFISRRIGPVDFVISNPPYLVPGDPIEEDVVLYEPHTALFAPDSDGLYFYRRIAEVPDRLVKFGGWAFVEVPPSRSGMIVDLFCERGWRGVDIIPDLTGRDRILVARKSY